MIKKFAAAIAIVLLTATVSFASSMKDIASSTFKLYSEDHGICSVTFLHNDNDGALFLTAAHCVDEPSLNLRRQKIDPKDLKTVLSESIYYVKAVRTSKAKDIAILQVIDKSVDFYEAPVDIATVEEAAKLSVGDPVMVVGYPAAEALSITKGEFTGKVPPIMGLSDPIYQTTAPVAGGNSGGGLYAQFGSEWKLIGTTSAKRTDNDIMTYFSTAETVNEALRGFASKTPVATIPDPRAGLRIDER